VCRRLDILEREYFGIEYEDEKKMMVRVAILERYSLLNCYHLAMRPLLKCTVYYYMISYLASDEMYGFKIDTIQHASSLSFSYRDGWIQLNH